MLHVRICAGGRPQGRSLPRQPIAIWFLTPFLFRYVERNALRANFVRRAEDWNWCSLYRWLHGAAEDKPSLAAWPAPRKAGWVEHVNAPQSEAELAAIRRSVERGNPFGNESWSDRAIRRLGLESTLRPRGRPKKQAEKGS